MVSQTRLSLTRFLLLLLPQCLEIKLNSGIEDTFNDDSKSDQFPLIKQLFFLPFIKSIVLDKHLILIEKLDFLEWKDVQGEVVEQIEKFLNEGGLIFQGSANPVTIYAENTPNPSVIKFVSNKKLVNIAHEFKSINDAEYCNIAKALFNHDYIAEIYIDFNFISVTIDKKFSWDEYTMQVRAVSYTHLTLPTILLV